MPATHIRLLALILSTIFLGVIAEPATAQQNNETAAWASIMDSQSPRDFVEFLQAFPDGDHVGDARREYSQLAHEKLPPEVQELQLNYPLEAAASGAAMRAQRYVILDVVVMRDGKAGAIKYTRRSGVDVMDQAAGGAARRATYLPAMDNGEAVEDHMTLRLNFNMVCPKAAFRGIVCNDFNNARGKGRP